MDRYPGAVRTQRPIKPVEIKGSRRMLTRTEWELMAVKEKKAQ
jgi:hypothetical protein